jgi:formylglycine-generating enzyme required for sulfatase activity
MLPAGWDPGMPVVGLSWTDAHAYAAWLTRHDARRSSRWRFELPPWTIRQDLGRPAAETPFVFGDRFRQSWTKSCYSRPRPCLEPSGSYPIDESPSGLFDVAGSVSEWCADDFWAERQERAIVGGAWMFARPERFEWAFLTGAPEDRASEWIGLRLMARPE